MQVFDEVDLAIKGYTVSFQGQGIIGRLRDQFFMRSGERCLTLSVDDTDEEALRLAWNKFLAGADESQRAEELVASPQARVPA